jgi:hypothetical protein
MGKYDKLGAYLRAQSADEVPMSFVEIERVIGAKLAPRAQFHRAWWSNNPSNNVMTQVWRDAGFKTERVDTAAGTVVFRREAGTKQETRMATQQPPGMEDEAREFKREEPEPEKKPRRHPLFGAMKGTFTLVPPSDDEPPPEDPDSWESLTLAKFDRLLFGKGG